MWCGRDDQITNCFRVDGHANARHDLGCLVGGTAMTAAQKRKRRSAIMAELSRMSKDWNRYTEADW